MIGDRGNKKWSSLMLPEHVELLNKFFEEDIKVEKPILSEDQKEEINKTLNEALEYSLKVKLSYYENKEIYNIVGNINVPVGNRMKIITDDDIIFVQLEDITNVEIL